MSSKFVQVDICEYDRSRGVGVIYVVLQNLDGDGYDDNFEFDRTYISHADLRTSRHDVYSERPYGEACDYAAEVARINDCEWGTN